MRNILNLGIRLLLITLVAGLVLGATQMLTEGPIQANQNAKVAAQFDAVLKAEQYDKIESVPQGIQEAYRASSGGQPAGIVFSVAGKGYGGAMTVIVGVDASGAVTGVRLGANGETPGIGSRAGETAYLDTFLGVSGKAEMGKNIDKLTSATVTSTGIISAVNTALEAYAALGGE